MIDENRDVGNGDDEDVEDDTDEGCSDGEITCGGQCIDDQDDLQHCGQCNNDCTQDAVANEFVDCVDGSCQGVCEAGYFRCDGQCVDDPSGCAVEIAVGSSHSCTRFDGGEVYCWGSNSSGQLGGEVPDGFEGPIRAQNISTATAIAAGELHTCAVLESGQVQCWGHNHFGQIGHGGSTDVDDSDYPSPQTVAGLSSARDIAAGAYFNCALLDDGTVKCWGDNYDGQLGERSEEEKQITPVDVPEVSSVAAISAGRTHACALIDDGTVYCWGSGDYGQLGDGQVPDADRNTPVQVADLPTATEIVVPLGGNYSCAVTEDKALYCWGMNMRDVFGDGASDEELSAVEVHELSAVAQVAVGSMGDGDVIDQAHICVRFEGGGVQCWGSNDNGRFGDGGSSDSATPVDALIDGDATDIDAGNEHTCAVIDGQGIQCWGQNFWQQLGDRSDDFSKDSPVWVKW